MSEKIFITGGTGMVGSEIVPLFLQETDAHIYLLLHEKGIADDKASIIESFFSLPPKKEFLERLNIVQGDITKDHMGLSEEEYRGLTKVITHVLHVAASTKFDLPLGEARRINVLGQNTVATFARDCTHIRQCGFFSTLYVCGKRTGRVKETELDHTAGFVNTYEQSKYEAEMSLRDFSKEIPISVFRLSTVIGSSTSGKVSHFIAPHQAIRMMHLGLAAMLPGTPDFLVDLISSDYTARIIFDLFWKKFLPDTTFHIAGGRKSFTLQEIIDESYRQIAIVEPAWALRGYPKPAIVPGEVFDLFMESAIAANNPVLQSTLRALNHFAHQMLYPKEFDQKNLLKVLPDYKKNLPDIRDYYGKIIQYCLKTKWGRLQQHGTIDQVHTKNM